MMPRALSLLSFLTLSAVAADSPRAPLARWSFGQEETSRLTEHGGVHRDVPGPRAPEFPDFEGANTAVKLDGNGAHFSFADAGAGSGFEFTNGDAITLEAWVNISDLRPGENVYVIGKGRTWTAGFPKDNQNWALRVREGGALAHVSFLFATLPEPQATAKDAHWHRWTGTAGFVPGSGWHHVAVSYKFGVPESLRAYLDGQAADGGSWDMGGATKQAPVVDEDAVWIGSSMGGSASNSFRGLLDEVMVHRESVAESVLKARFHRAGKTAAAPPVIESMPGFDWIPKGRVLMTFHEDAGAHERWGAAEAVPAESTRWLGESFILPRLPLRYEEWGIRESWKGPVQVRMAADVPFEAGKHRVLVRARGLSRLWIDGQLVARTKAMSNVSDGHQPVPPLSQPPLPGMRPSAYADNEGFGEIELTAGTHRVVFELMAGGKKYRAEPGEACVAIESADGRAFAWMAPLKTNERLLTDEGWEDALSKFESALGQCEDETRRTAAASRTAFWDKRHVLTRQWAAEHPAPLPPKTGNPIDAFISAKIERAVSAAAAADPEESRYFHGTVMPVLRENCFRCHGEKEKGGLKLNTREAALKSGESGHAAVLPNAPQKSEMLARLRSRDEDERMPPKAPLDPAQIALLEKWIADGAQWPAPPVSDAERNRPGLIGDAAFLRRASLDTIGVPPSEDEARAFLAEPGTDKRGRAIERLLGDARFADQWVSYWQDVLAENPGMLKPSLNNTGPFRWFLHEALRDNKPLDRLVTELVMMRGSRTEGGSAGFGMAADNDAPLAAKGQVLAGAFLGIELQCARCHDSPYHSTTQRDLYSLAAMLDRKTVTVPKSSTVPAAFFEKKARESLIRVTLKNGEPVTPKWPFEKTCGFGEGPALEAFLENPTDTRERLAALLTAPQNERFAQVIANRLWKRLMGAGFVEPAHDWEGHAPSHPELLQWLAHEFVAHDYDLRHLVRLVLNSESYQRAATGNNLQATAEARFFSAPERRRLAAEQVVDSLATATGKALDTEELTFDPDGRRASEVMISLGKPSRAWMFASLSNERDRPSLSLPRAQSVTDVLEAFGWTASRQNPRTDRETDANVLQPGVLANSIVSTWATGVSLNSPLAQVAIDAKSPETLVDSIFLRFLTRPPTAAERQKFAATLAPGFEQRIVPSWEVRQPPEPPRLSRISWSTHLVAEATTINLEMEQRAHAGAPADPRLVPEWREGLEDVLWALVNLPEFVWMP